MYVILHHTLLVARQIGGRDEAKYPFFIVFHCPDPVTMYDECAWFIMAHKPFVGHDFICNLFKGFFWLRLFFRKIKQITKTYKFFTSYRFLLITCY